MRTEKQRYNNGDRETVRTSPIIRTGATMRTGTNKNDGREKNEERDCAANF